MAKSAKPAKPAKPPASPPSGGDAAETGAPIAKDAIDPDLVRLQRRRPEVGIVTAAGIVFLCAFFLFRLSPDRRFSAGGEHPTEVAVADVLAGKVDADRFVAIDVDPMMAHAIRANQSKGNIGLRVAPARGTGDRLWMVIPGDGWTAPVTGPHIGRLRRLDELPFAAAVAAYAEAHPRPMFAAAAAVRAGLTSGKVATVSGDEVSPRDGDLVAFDVVDPDAASLIASFNDRLPDAAAWTAALTAAGIVGQVGGIPGIAPSAAPPKVTGDQARYELSLAGAVPALTAKLEAAGLWAARVEPVIHHFETTWGALRGAAPTGFTVGTTTIPDRELDLLGLYVGRGIPGDAWALVTTERPADYWYVMPITIGLAIIGLLFAWALVRAVKRDLLVPRAAS
jgi:hypothetical protein